MKQLIEILKKKKNRLFDQEMDDSRNHGNESPKWAVTVCRHTLLLRTSYTFVVVTMSLALFRFKWIGRRHASGLLSVTFRDPENKASERTADLKKTDLPKNPSESRQQQQQAAARRFHLPAIKGRD